MDAETASKNKSLKNKNEIDKKAWQHSPPQQQPYHHRGGDYEQ